MKKINLLIVVMAFSILLALTACSSNSSKTNSDNTSGANTTPAASNTNASKTSVSGSNSTASSSTTISDSNVVAKFGNKTITIQDVNNAFAKLPKQMTAPFQNNPKGKQQFMQSFLQEYIQQQLLAYEAKKEGLDKSAKFTSMLKELKSMILTKLLIEQNVKVNVTNADVQNAYNKEKSHMVVPAQLDISEIVVKSQATAAMLLKKAIANSASFAALATKYSTNKDSAKKGGELGLIAKSDLFGPLKTAVKNVTKPGILNAVVDLGKGSFAVVKVNKVVPSKTISFNQVKQQLKQQLTQTKESTKVQAYINNIKTQNNFQLNSSAVNTLTGGPAQPLGATPVSASAPAPAK